MAAGCWGDEPCRGGQDGRRRHAAAVLYIEAEGTVAQHCRGAPLAESRRGPGVVSAGGHGAGPGLMLAAAARAGSAAQRGPSCPARPAVTGATRAIIYSTRAGRAPQRGGAARHRRRIRAAIPFELGAFHAATRRVMRRHARPLRRQGLPCAASRRGPGSMGPNAAARVRLCRDRRGLEHGVCRLDAGCAACMTTLALYDGTVRCLDDLYAALTICTLP